MYRLAAVSRINEWQPPPLPPPTWPPRTAQRAATGLAAAGSSPVGLPTAPPQRTASLPRPQQRQRGPKDGHTQLVEGGALDDCRPRQAAPRGATPPPPLPSPPTQTTTRNKPKRARHHPTDAQ